MGLEFSGWMRAARRPLGTCLLVLVAVGLVVACAPKEDWSDPAWISYRMGIGDDRAFMEFSRLSAEQKTELVPRLVEVYNEGIRREAALVSLIEARDERGREVFLSALQRPSDREAGLGARGLAAIGDTASATAIAQRVNEVSSPDAYAPFMEALLAIPSPQAAEVVAGTLLRPANRIGGINTVRNGCRLLGSVDDASDEMITAMVFGLVNFIPMPFEDALDACELALLSHGDRAVPALAELLRAENTRVRDHLVNLEYPPVTGQVRAARVLSRRGSDAALAVFAEFFRTNTPIPRADMMDLSVQMQSEWYSAFGQLFEIGVKSFALRGNDEDRALLRSLEQPGDGQALDNFREWMNLSDGAEVGFRQAVHEAMAIINHPEDRRLLVERAVSGRTARGGVRTDVMLRLNALHYLGRTTPGDEMALFERVLRAQPEAFRSQFAPLRAYFLVAEECGDDFACYGRVYDDPSDIAADEAFTSLLEGMESEDEQAATRRGIHSAARQAVIWQLVIVHREQPEALSVLVDRMAGSDMNRRLQITNALLFARALPASAAERIDGFIEDEESVRGVPHLREVRHGYRLLRQLRF
ncbi:MAG: hypothetical protein EA398_01390 [Deltaproteobacteria bacterium]|nr:MAG: hypothetical protein EA398_01390 [Deltaproteobacteria bacterium]